MRARPLICVLALAVSVIAVAALGTPRVDESSGGARGCKPAWKVVASPAVKQGTLDDVAVRSATDAWAVGGIVRIGGITGGEIVSSSPLVEHWDGKKWSVVPVPAAKGMLTDVAIVSQRDAWAVGFVGRNTRDGQPLVLHWNGRTWSGVPLPASVRAASAVAAIGAKDVWVAGTSGDFMTSTGEVSHWDGRSWTRVLARNDADLSDLTAFSGRDVWAVGASDDGTLPLLLHWDGKSWTASSRKPQSGYDEAWLLTVAGTSPTDVWAGGGQHQEELSPPAIAPFMAHWDGKSWASSRFELAGETEFRGIAPVSSDEAWAVSANSWSYELQGGGAFQSWRRTGNRWRATDLPRGWELMDIASVPGRPASAPVLWAVGQRGARITDYATRTTPLIRRYGC